ncbi:MAG: glycoside hydrolase family 5 protein [Treponema sp.]|jgi:endoglucanase|nr:glycoside hydrolase family 5 protein [Treponema sp.]
MDHRQRADFHGLWHLPVAALAFAAAIAACAATPDPAGLMRDISPMALAADMGAGVNIGNTLDSIWDGPSPAMETGWGNPAITRGFIAALRNHGYRTVRLPVTWAEHLGAAPDYVIEESWLARVEEVASWCLDEGLYVVVNLHHDGGDSEESWIKDAAADADRITRKFTAVWAQIADRFRDAPDYLVFEAMNEVGFDSLSLGDAQTLLARLNQAFVDTVRASGGNNAVRWLLAAGYWTDIDRTCDSRYRLPADGQNRILLSVHYYTPSTFCIADAPNNSWGFRADWGTAADYAELAAQFDKLNARFTSQGVPVVLGEYGVTKKNKDEASRVKWMTAVTQICLDNGICPVLWDTGGEISRTAPYAMSNSLQTVMTAPRRIYFENLYIEKNR